MAAPLMQNERFLKIAMPVAIGVIVIVLWHLLVKGFDVPKYIVPSPALVIETLIQDRELLFGSLLITLKITFFAFFARWCLAPQSHFFSCKAAGWSTRSFPTRCCCR